jgi:hypothetical protein
VELPFHGKRLKDGWQLVVVEQAPGKPLTSTNIATLPAPRRSGRI